MGIIIYVTFSRYIKPACENFVSFLVGATCLWWHHFYVKNKMLIILQHEVWVTFANSEIRKNCKAELTISQLKKIWTGIKSSWEQVNSHDAHLSGAETKVNRQKVSPKNFGKFFISRYRETNEGAIFVFPVFSSVAEKFWCCPFFGSKSFDES